jgi:DNA-binding IscR family transcriptional regulator
MTWLVSSAQGLLVSAIIISTVSGVYGGIHLADEFAKINSIMYEAAKASASGTTPQSYIQS